MTNNSSRDIFVPQEMPDGCLINDLPTDRSKVSAQDMVEFLVATNESGGDILLVLEDDEELTDQEKAAALVCFRLKQCGACVVKFGIEVE